MAAEKQTERTRAREWAASQGLSGGEIARYSGISRQSVTKFLRGVSNSPDVAEPCASWAALKSTWEKCGKSQSPSMNPLYSSSTTLGKPEMY